MLLLYIANGSFFILSYVSFSSVIEKFTSNGTIG